MPSLEGSRGTVWPGLCRAMRVWLEENEAPRALIIDTDRINQPSKGHFPHRPADMKPPARGAREGQEAPLAVRL